jgi:hypothetical protein
MLLYYHTGAPPRSVTVTKAAVSTVIQEPLATTSVQLASHFSQCHNTDDIDTDEDLGPTVGSTASTAATASITDTGDVLLATVAASSAEVPAATSAVAAAAAAASTSSSIGTQAPQAAVHHCMMCRVA